MLADFPDVLTALRTGIPAILNGQTVKIAGADVVLEGIAAGTSLPADLEGRSVNGFLRFSTLQDPDNEITRFMSVDVETFCTRYDRGYAIAERIRGILLSETRIGGVVLDRRITTSGPREVRWDDNDNVRRFLSTHRISTRR